MLTGRDLDAFNAIVHGWEQSDGPLPGCVSYQDAFDLIARLGGDRPQKMIERLEALERLNAIEKRRVASNGKH